MSLKEEIQTWVTALQHYDNNEYDQCIRCFESIADTSKIYFNLGVIHATLGEHEKAVEHFSNAIKLDQYMAIAYFQQGVSNFLMGDFEEALANFNDTLLYLRGNASINYEQLGLKFKLYSCEVLFNRGLCYIYLDQRDSGMTDLVYAAKEKVVPDHDVIDEALKEEAEGYTVFSIPVGIVYRPNDAKIKNLGAKDYLGKARLVAALNKDDLSEGFAVAERQMASATKALDDRPLETISYAATNLVKQDIASKARQASVTTINRQGFPPTPPPDYHRPSISGSSDSQTSISLSSNSPKNVLKPRPLKVGSGSIRSKNPPYAQLPPANRSQDPRRKLSNAYSQKSESSTWDEPRKHSVYSNRGRSRPSARSHRYDDDFPPPGDAEDIYDYYATKNSRDMSRSRARYFAAQTRDNDVEYEMSDDDQYFDMVRNKLGRLSIPSRSQSRSQSRDPGRSPGWRDDDDSYMSTASSARSKNIRVKVHADDVRYVVIKPNVDFVFFIDQISSKFGIRVPFRIQMRDDGDMITMSDQDDLNLAILSALNEAKRVRSDMAKMEVWVSF